MVTTNYAITRALGAAALGAGVFIASNAFAIDPGNTLDSNGCEHGIGYEVNNWCDSGENGIHLQANFDAQRNTGYYITGDQNGSSAYAEAKCNDGSVIHIGNFAGSGAFYYCPNAGTLAQHSVCGAKSVCASEF